MANGSVVIGLDTRHPDSKKLLPTWSKCRDVREGQTAVHAAGVKYLPKLSSQTPDEYAAYKQRAAFYGATSRTIDAFSGMLMRLPPAVDSESALLDSVNHNGDSLYEFISDIVDELFTVNFGGVLVDHPPLQTGITQAQATQAGLRPYMCFYKAENVINWRKSKVNGQDSYIQVVLEEEEYSNTSEFEIKETSVYRVLDLDSDGVYRQRVFVKGDKENEFIQRGDDVYPLMSGNRMTSIPFFAVGECELPPMVDVVDLNISHYMSVADLENGAHFTGIPQPVVSGVILEEGKTLPIGGTKAWVFPDAAAKATYLEFSGQGLGALERRIDAKEKQMAALGARMLSDSTVSETATSSNLRATGEFSVLSRAANSLSKVMTRATSAMLVWAGEQPCTVKINTDFLPKGADAQTILAWLQLYQAGTISFQSLYENLKQGEVVLHGKTPEDEGAAIGLNLPPIAG